MKEFIHKTFSKLNIKILVLVCAVSIIPTLALAIVGTMSYANRSISTESNNLYSRSEVLGQEIVTSGFLENKSDSNVGTRLNELAQLISGRVMVVDSSLRVVYDSYGTDEGKIFLWENITRSANGEQLSDLDSNTDLLTTTVPIKVNPDSGYNDVDETEIKGVILASESIGFIYDNLNHVIAVEVIIFVLIVILAIVVGVLIGNRYANPIKEASNQFAKGIKGEEINEIDVRGYTEIEELAEQFNTYVNKMETIDQSRQEFVSNVSHELKTPLTSMKVLADSLIGMGEAPVELYQEFMGDIAQEIERETGIINDLLSMVRMDKSNAKLNISDVNVNELTESILKRLRPIAEKQEVELVLESFRPITAEVDEVKLSLAISNLIENGIKYNNPGGFVHISLNSDHQYFYVRVEDSGMGIPEESLDYIFERFYRVDKSHSREIGGTGLGLAITHMSILMHGGEIKVDSTLGEGTTFDVRIPLNHIEGNGVRA